MHIEKRAYARAGLLGNPSDGYFGKIIAVSVKNFWAAVTLEPAEHIRIEPLPQDVPAYGNLRELAETIKLYGYYGGVRLIQALMKRFYDYAQEAGLRLRDENFSIRYASNIPRQIGLGGSSAIVTATLRALMEFYEVEVPKEMQPTLILEAERNELGINAGFMDRVTQVYEGCVYMDLNKEFVQARGRGIYEKLDASLLPPLYLAYKRGLGKVSGSVLNEIRVAYDRGDKTARETLNALAALAERGKRVLTERNYAELHRMMDENFELRSRIQTISTGNAELIRAARKAGAAAKFAGSGGSIIGMYADDAMYEELERRLKELGAEVIRPVVE